MEHLDTFIAAREVAFGLWLAGMAETRPSFRKQLPAEFGYIERSLRIVLRPPSTPRSTTDRLAE